MRSKEIEQAIKRGIDLVVAAKMASNSASMKFSLEPMNTKAMAAGARKKMATASTRASLAWTPKVPDCG